MALLSYRSLALWMLGYPEAALADADRALSDARDIGHAADFDVCAVRHSVYPYRLRILRDGKLAI